MDGNNNSEEMPVLEKQDISSAQKPNKNEKRDLIQSLYDITETFCVAVVAMLLLFMFVFRYVTVVGTSMTDTLSNGDTLIISDLLYTPSNGDIVVIRTEEHPLIKRVIATGGQNVRIDFDTWQVWVSDDDVFDDSDKLTEDYVKYDYSGISLRELNKGSYVYQYMVSGTNTCEFTVPENEIFVMGDNRNGSTDSRSKGCFECHEIIGRVIFRLSPKTGIID